MARNVPGTAGVAPAGRGVLAATNSIKGPTVRVIFQMSANDSASLIDNPKAANLGLHRALLYNEQEGTLETFRPYAMPDAEWLRDRGARMPSQRA